MSYSFFTGLNRYTFPYCIFSKTPVSTSETSSLVACRVLKPICSAKQTAGRNGYLLQVLYAFTAPFSVNRFSCGIYQSIKMTRPLYINFMKRVCRFLKRVSRSIKYICNVVLLTYRGDNKCV